jgi:3',5'-cyclic AMP phosphodiesterase CpdA
VISDLNGSYGSSRYGPAVHEAVAALVARRPDLVISTGDMVGGQRLQPLLEERELAAMWGAFHDAVTAPLARAGVPLAVTPGNHDASAYPAFARERERYGRDWRKRRPAVQFIDDAYYPFRYAFSVEDVLFVSLDVTRTGSLDAGQRRWLDALLGDQASRYRHRVVFSHLPIYAFTRGRENEVSGDLELERILVRHGVELYLSGHHHAFYPGFHGGIRYVGQACLGGGPRALIGTRDRSAHAITWLEFDDDELRITALTGRGFAELLPMTELPASIKGPVAELVRDDLRPRDLSVEDRRMLEEGDIR